MSTLKTTNIAHPSSASNNIVLDSAGGVDLDALTVSGSAPADSVNIDASGRLLVGTSSTFSTCLADFRSIPGSTGGTIVAFSRGDDGTASDQELGTLLFTNSSGNRAASIAVLTEAGWGGSGSADYPGRLVFATTSDGASSPTERMRIDNNGRILIGSTSQDFTGQANKISRSQGPSSTSTAWADQVTPLGVYGNFGNGGGNQQCSSALTVYGWSSNGTGGAIMRGWWSSVQASLSTPTLVYQVAASGNVTNTNNSYGSLSDVRYKQDIIEAGSQWNDIKNITIKKFRFIDSVQNETKENPAPYQLGCIAQEVVRVSPGLVEIRGDDKDENGDVIPNVLTIKYSVLYMKAVKALQEAMERIEQLEAEMAEVKARLS